MHRCLGWLCALLVALFVVGCGGSDSGITPGGQWTIGPAGGTFNTPGNKVRLVVPAGAVAGNTAVTVTQMAVAPTAPAGTVYVPGTAWSFSHTAFTAPASLTIAFAAGTPTAGLKLYRLADGANEWAPVATTIDAGARTATAQVNSFSSYALFYAEGAGWAWTAAGGTFAFDTLTVTLPAGAVTTDVEVQARRTPAPFTPPLGWAAVEGATFDLGSSNTELTTTTPFTVSMTYIAGAVPADLRDDVRVFYKENEGSAWVALESTAVAADRKVSTTSMHLGTFAAFYPGLMASSVYWIEQRSQQQSNNVFLDVYTAAPGGSENLAFSPNRMQGSNQLRTDTFRWSDKSYLGLEFGSGTDMFLMSFNVQTNTATRLFWIPNDAGTIISSLEMARANRLPNSKDYAIQFAQRETTTGEVRERLLLFRDGVTDPEVLLDVRRTDEEPPAIMRPWDVAADGRVLALTENGLTMFADHAQHMIAGPDDGPGPAFFSPSGTQILYVQHTGEGAGWKVFNIATREVTAITGPTNGDKVRWGTDDSYLVTAVPSGPDRHVELYHVATGATLRITTAGAHSTSFINDVGVQ